MKKTIFVVLTVAMMLSFIPVTFGDIDYALVYAEMKTIKVIVVEMTQLAKICAQGKIRVPKFGYLNLTSEMLDQIKTKWTTLRTELKTRVNNLP